MFNDVREDGRRIVETKVETSTEIDHGINLVRENLCILEVSRSLAVLLFQSRGFHSPLRLITLEATML